MSLARSDPGVQPVDRADGLVFAAVDLGWPWPRRRAAASAAGVRAPPVSALARGLRRRREQVAAAVAGMAGPIAPRGVAAGAARRACADVELGVGLDLVRLDAGLLGDAPRQRRELHRLEERDQLLVVRLVHGEVFDRRPRAARCWSSVTSCLEMRASSALSISVWRRLSCLISPARASSVSRSPIFADQLRRGLDADAGHARHVVGGIAGQRLHVDHLVRRHAELLDHLRRRRSACPSSCRT